MNLPEEQVEERGYPRVFAANDMVMKMIFGTSEHICSFDTYQFDDYSKVVSSKFDPASKAKRREEVFPVDCQRAFELGVRLAGREQQ